MSQAALQRYFGQSSARASARGHVTSAIGAHRQSKTVAPITAGPVFRSAAMHAGINAAAMAKTLHEFIGRV